MPPAPSLRSTSPGPGDGVSAGSTRRSSFEWMRHASMVDSFLLQRIPALAESLVGLIEMTMHRRARRNGIVRDERLQHCAVLGDRALPELRRVVVVLELLEQRPHTLFPQHLEHVDKRAVPGRLGDPQMKGAVARERLLAFLQFLLHLV